MTQPSQLTIFGEVLFDCFPNGERILGGAPFNVAWHSQALGNRPQFISRVGDDDPGEEILSAMHDWRMETAGIQFDTEHQTGRVAVEVCDGEPRFEILADCAYDFIDTEKINPADSGILYHGSLGLRNSISRTAFGKLSQNPALSIFLDVNLRPPWWQKNEVFQWLKKARWVKLNQDELSLLGFDSGDTRRNMAEFQAEFQIEQLILTRGAEGALVRTSDAEYHRILPARAQLVIDTVGAGDAFSAIYIHGLLADWSIGDTLEVAQEFASKIIGLRGATTTDSAFYRDFIDSFIR
jgi:fructokinase